MTNSDIPVESMSEDRDPREGMPPPRPRRRLGLPKKERLFAVLPTTLTLGNVFCGFAAITFAAKVGPDDVLPDGGHLLVAAGCIFFAMVFDALDGRAARWAGQTSEFGAQLDSLCDAVSFGVAPAFLMRQFSAHSIFHSRILWMIGALYVACAILRLARFNVETDEDDSHTAFSGLPSPAAAGVVASFPVAMYGLNNLAGPPTSMNETVARILEWFEPAIVQALPFVTFIVACLMVSRIRYAHVFNQMFSGRRTRGHLIQILFSIAAIFIVRELALPLIFLYFAFASPLRALWTHWIAPYFQRPQATSQPTPGPH